MKEDFLGYGMFATEKPIAYTTPVAHKMYKFSEGQKVKVLGKHPDIEIDITNLVTTMGVAILDGEAIYSVKDSKGKIGYMSECYLVEVIDKVEPEDKVNPSHYKLGGMETFDFMATRMTHEELIGFCKGNVLKYTARASFKGEETADLKKAQWYMDKLVSLIESK